jgi:hypothetical protein
VSKRELFAVVDKQTGVERFADRGSDLTRRFAEDCEHVRNLESAAEAGADVEKASQRFRKGSQLTFDAGAEFEREPAAGIVIRLVGTLCVSRTREADDFVHVEGIAGRLPYEFKQRRVWLPAVEELNRVLEDGVVRERIETNPDRPILLELFDYPLERGRGWMRSPGNDPSDGVRGQLSAEHSQCKERHLVGPLQVIERQEHWSVGRARLELLTETI